MLFVVFSYEREQMLKSLIDEIDYDHIVIDDGSKFSLNEINYCDLIRTNHEGKKGFWKKWMLAHQIALGTDYDWFCFLPDDVKDLDLKAIKGLCRDEYKGNLCAFNLSNEGSRYRWGEWSTGQEDIELEGYKFQECGYVDGCFVTNRTTLECMEMPVVPDSWFDRPDKSSGVGYFMTQEMRKLGAVMMLPEYSLLYHGDHESKMHKDHRQDVKLISKRK